MTQTLCYICCIIVLVLVGGKSYLPAAELEMECLLHVNVNNNQWTEFLYRLELCHHMKYIYFAALDFINKE